MKRIGAHHFKKFRYWRFFWLFAGFVGCLLITTSAAASEKERHIQVNFSFNHQGFGRKLVVGYRLYKDNQPLCQSYSAVQQSIDCSFISDGGLVAFTLTAFYNDESESPHSAPFHFLFLDETMIITSLQALTGQEPDCLQGVGLAAGEKKIGLDDVLAILSRTGNQP